jgi:hypothetical protein
MVRPTGQIVINRPSSGVNGGFLLSKYTGLLEAGEEYEVIPIQTDATSQVPFGDKEEKIIPRESLLNYNIGPGDIVRIQSRKLNGIFRIVRGRHKGTRDGDWKTQMELREI